VQCVDWYRLADDPVGDVLQYGWQSLPVPPLLPQHLLAGATNGSVQWLTPLTAGPAAASFHLPAGVSHLRAVVRDGHGAEATLILPVNVTAADQWTAAAEAVNAPALVAYLEDRSAALLDPLLVVAPLPVPAALLAVQQLADALAAAVLVAPAALHNNSAVLALSERQAQVLHSLLSLPLLTSSELAQSASLAQLAEQTLAAVAAQLALLDHADGFRALLAASTALITARRVNLAATLPLAPLPLFEGSRWLGITSALLRNCSELPAVNEMLQGVLSLSLQNTGANQQREWRTDNLDAAVLRAYTFSDGFSIGGVSLPALPEHADTLSPNSPTSLDLSAPAGAVLPPLLDMRVVNWSPKWAACAGSDSLRSVDLGLVDGNSTTVNTTHIPVDVAVLLQPQTVDAALEGMRLHQCDPDAPLINTTQALQEGVECGHVDRVTQTFSTAGCRVAGVTPLQDGNTTNWSSAIVHCQCSGANDFTVRRRTLPPLQCVSTSLLYPIATALFAVLLIATAGHWHTQRRVLLHGTKPAPAATSKAELEGADDVAAAVPVRVLPLSLGREHALIGGMCALRIVHCVLADGWVDVSSSFLPLVPVLPLLMYAALLVSASLWLSRFLHFVRQVSMAGATVPARGALTMRKRADTGLEDDASNPKHRVAAKYAFRDENGVAAATGTSDIIAQQRDALVQLSKMPVLNWTGPEVKERPTVRMAAVAVATFALVVVLTGGVVSAITNTDSRVDLLRCVAFGMACALLLVGAAASSTRTRRLQAAASRLVPSGDLRTLSWRVVRSGRVLSFMALACAGCLVLAVLLLSATTAGSEQTDYLTVINGVLFAADWLWLAALLVVLHCANRTYRRSQHALLALTHGEAMVALWAKHLAAEEEEAAAAKQREEERRAAEDEAARVATLAAAAASAAAAAAAALAIANDNELQRAAASDLEETGAADADKTAADGTASPSNQPQQPDIAPKSAAALVAAANAAFIRARQAHQWSLAKGSTGDSEFDESALAAQRMPQFVPVPRAPRGRFNAPRSIAQARLATRVQGSMAAAVAAVAAEADAKREAARAQRTEGMQPILPHVGDTVESSGDTAASADVAASAAAGTDRAPAESLAALVQRTKEQLGASEQQQKQNAQSSPTAVASPTPLSPPALPLSPSAVSLRSPVASGSRMVVPQRLMVKLPSFASVDGSASASPLTKMFGSPTAVPSDSTPADSSPLTRAVEKLQSQLHLPALELPQQALYAAPEVGSVPLPSLPPVVRKDSNSDGSGDGHFVIVEREECPLPGEVAAQKLPAEGEEDAAATSADATTTDATRSLRRASSTSNNSSGSRKSSTAGSGPSTSPLSFATPQHAAIADSATPTRSRTSSWKRSSGSSTHAEGQPGSVELGQLSPGPSVSAASSPSSSVIASLGTAAGLVASMATRLARARSRADSTSGSPFASSSSGAVQSVSVGAGQVRGSAAAVAGRVRVSEQADAREKVNAHGFHAESEDAEIIGDLRLVADRGTLSRRQAQQQQQQQAAAAGAPRASPHRRGMSDAGGTMSPGLISSGASVIPSLLPSSGLMASLLQRSRSNLVQRIAAGSTGGGAVSTQQQLSGEASDPLSPMGKPIGSPVFKPSLGRQSTRVIEYGDDSPGFSPAPSPTNRRAMTRRQPSMDFQLNSPSASGGAAEASMSPLISSPLMLPASATMSTLNSTAVSPGGPSVRGALLPPPADDLAIHGGHFSISEEGRLPSVSEQHASLTLPPPLPATSQVPSASAAPAHFGRRRATSSAAGSTAAASSELTIESVVSRPRSNSSAAAAVAGSPSAASLTAAPAGSVTSGHGATAAVAATGASAAVGRRGTALSRLASRRQGGAS